MKKLNEVQEHLSEKVKGSFLLHLIINDLKFHIALMILGPIALGSVLLIPKIWTVTPDEFRPIVKISGLDFVQSWSLARAARQHEAAEDYDAALYSWEVAISNHPTQISNLRSAIASYQKLDKPDAKQIARNINYSLWLLRLNQTNLADLELIAESLDRSRLDQLQYSILTPHKDELSESTRAAYTRTLFNLYRHQEFDEQWKRLSDSSRADPKNAPYGIAYNALWGAPREAEASIQELENRLDSENSQLLPEKLLLLVHFHQKNEVDYQLILKRLQAANQARYSHYIAYWSLLVHHGDSATALELATQYAEPPSNPADLISHIKILQELGALQEADTLIQANLNAFPPETSLYSAYAELFIELSDWDRLREIAIGLRKLTTEQTAVSLSYFLEGTADVKQHRLNSADTAFSKFTESTNEQGIGTELGLARELILLGFSKHAHTVLQKVESHYEQYAGYWYTRAGCAFQIKLYDEMRMASEKAFEIEPTNAAYKSALVEALLLLREEPARTVRLTLELISQNPQSFSHHINHVLALLLNDRIQDAAQILRQLPEELAPDAQARAAYHYAQFGVEFLEGDYQQAKEFAAKVPEQLLSTKELEWFKESQAIISKNL